MCFREWGVGPAISRIATKNWKHQHYVHLNYVQMKCKFIAVPDQMFCKYCTNVLQMYRCASVKMLCNSSPAYCQLATEESSVRRERSKLCFILWFWCTPPLQYWQCCTNVQLCIILKCSPNVQLCTCPKCFILWFWCIHLQYCRHPYFLSRGKGVCILEVGCCEANVLQMHIMYCSLVPVLSSPVSTMLYKCPVMYYSQM